MLLRFPNGQNLLLLTFLQALDTKKSSFCGKIDYGKVAVSCAERRR